MSVVHPPKPQTQTPQSAAAPSGPVLKRLKKGEHLFNEGETSRAMYLIKSGMVRIYKKKGDSSIEIDTVRAGSILGELAFLDGNPRSASGEALTDLDIVEISGPTFTSILAAMPEWLKALLKTLVGRLRTASTRIRQLEQASSSVDYSKEGARTYLYLSYHDVLKISVGLLLACSRSGTKVASGIEVDAPTVSKFVNQILQIPEAKIHSVIDIFTQLGITEGSADSPKYIIKNLNFLEEVVNYLNAENQLEPSKKHDITSRSFALMGLLQPYVSKAMPNPEGMATINVMEALNLENAKQKNKDPYKVESFNELSKHGYLTQPVALDPNTATSQVKKDHYLKQFQMQRVAQAIATLNEQKRNASVGAKVA